MKNFDLHCHPALKTFLGSHVEEKRPDCWQKVDVKGIWEVADKIVGNIIDSQSSLSQIENGKFQLVVASLYSVEHSLIVGTIAKITNINILSESIKELSHTLTQNIVDKEKGYGYNDILKKLQNHLLNSQNVNGGFKQLNKIGDLKEGQLNVILSIEGAHALYNDLNNYSEAEILQNLDDLKKSNYRYLYMTLTHLATNPFANQCYGMKIIDNKHFKPVGNGISQLGDKVIKKALNKNEGNRILIDVKHMSLKSRLQYYDRISNGVYPEVPIIVSHCGVTGVSYQKMPIYKVKEDVNQNYIEVEYLKPQGLQNTEFNPWSINLYDEEIDVIIKSGGLMGIIMEERILGVDKVTSEFFSKEEFNDYRNDVKAQQSKYKRAKTRRDKKNFEEEEEAYLTGRYIRHLCNNILHIVKVGGEKAWDHICFGTDYDGMINALNFCKTADKFEKMERKLERILPDMAESDKKTNYFLTNRNGKIDKKKVKKIVKGILYDNAINFLNKHFN